MRRIPPLALGLPALAALFTLTLAFERPAAAATPTAATRGAVDVESIYRNYPVVEVVTMGIGGRIWERHGHIALCVRYADPRRDRCYNYGTGNFGEPLKMTWGFFRGENSFWVSENTPEQMLRVYHYTDRTIWAQPLPLTDEEEQAIIARLEHDVLPENRYYSYDHFWDNCTTRVRDIVDDATGGRLRNMEAVAPERTYRDLARDGFFGMRVPLLITDIAMGRSTDRLPSYWERMFLPDYMREAVELEFGVEPIVVYQRRGPPHVPDGPSGRVLLALIIVVLTSPVWLTRRWGRFQRTGLAIAIAPYFLLGLILWVLAIISPLSYVRWNETLLLWLPLDLAMVFLSPARRRLYARGRLIMLAIVALAMAVGVLHQPLWAPLLWPLIPCAVIGLWPERDRSRR